MKLKQVIIAVASALLMLSCTQVGIETGDKEMQTTLMPEFSVTAGAYGSIQQVGITTTTAEAVIYYTTDGIEPGATSLVLASGSTITVDKDMTIKAVAIKSGWKMSAVASASYQIYTDVTAALEVALATADGKIETDYTADSWKTFQTILTVVKAMVQTTEAEVIKKTEAINASLSGLITKASRNLLVAALSEADTKIEADYSQTSWSSFKTSLTSAKALLETTEYNDPIKN
ncbi:MAG TPA: hypothetical protein DC057_00905, partial [Spirochaetia bacterium]|nr:hypothetical protein [Spirochaetia bacterium]